MLIQVSLIIVTFSILFYGTIIGLVREWWYNPDFSHGFLIPLAVAWMIWRKRSELVASGIEPGNWGLLILMAGLVMHFLGTVGSEFFTSRTAIVFTLLGLSVYLLGWPLTREMFIPILYLAFMIPIPAIIWNQISFPLQLLASNLAAEFIAFIGIPVLREGNILQLANTKLEVVNACSGLRSLMSMSALSCIVAYLSPLSRAAKWVLFLSAIPIAIAANSFRLVSTAFLGLHFGRSFMEGVVHDISGVMVFLVAVGLLSLTYAALIRFERT